MQEPEMTPQVGNSNGEAKDDQSRRERSAVWFTCQRPRVQQRNGDRYDEESFAHPGKMLPDVTRTILDTYGESNDIWCDPMCGIGTTLVEGMFRGYTVYGLEWEQRWVEVTKKNLQRAIDLGALGQGHVQQGDARRLSEIFGGDVFDKISFSPPYGNTLSRTSHGPDKHPERQKGGKRAAKAIRHGYTFVGTEEAAVPDNPGDMSVKTALESVNLGDLKHGNVSEAVTVCRYLVAGQVEKLSGIKPSYLTEMAKVYHQCYQSLKFNGMLVLVLRDYRREKRRVDLLGDTVDLCEALGFRYYDRSVALQCPVESVGEETATCVPEGHLGFWTVHNSKTANPPLMVPVFEDIVVFVKDAKARKK